MYKVTNITKSTEFECDAIETITVENNVYRPIDPDKADGFKALTIVEVSPSEQYYTEEAFVYAGHTLLGTEDV